MTKSKSRNPRTKKGARTAPTIKPAAKKSAAAKRPKPTSAASKPLAPKSVSSPAKNTGPTRKKTKTPAPASALTTEQRIVDALENLKGKDIVCMDVRKLTDVTDTLIIVSGTSNRHVKSIADNAAMELKKAGKRAYNIEGADAGEWVLVDFGDVVLHVMQPHIREFYDLEKLWGTPAVDPSSTDITPVNKKPSPKKPSDKNRE